MLYFAAVCVVLKSRIVAASAVTNAYQVPEHMLGVLVDFQMPVSFAGDHTPVSADLDAVVDQTGCQNAAAELPFLWQQHLEYKR